MLHVIFARVRNGFHSPAGLGKKSERAGAGGGPKQKRHRTNTWPTETARFSTCELLKPRFFVKNYAKLMGCNCGKTTCLKREVKKTQLEPKNKRPKIHETFGEGEAIAFPPRGEVEIFKSFEQWNKGPWLFRVYIGTGTIPSDVGIIINHYKDLY